MKTIFFLRRLYLPTSLLGITSQNISGLHFLRVNYSINQFNKYEPFKFSADFNKVLEILAASSVTWKFHTEDPQILSATLQNSLTRATWSLEFVRFCSSGYFINHKVSQSIRTAIAVYLCALHGSPNEERVFPYTALTGFYNPDGECLLRVTEMTFTCNARQS